MSDMEYKVHIKQFSGPLDLLLHLIEKAEVDIKDVFVSEITAEFLDYMKQLDELDMEQASSFLTVAATLVYVKSRSIFPAEPKPDDTEEEDPGEVLIRQLKEYKVYKQASEKMKLLYDEAASMHVKLPEEFPLPPREIILKDTTVQGLFAAMLAAINRTAGKEAETPSHEVTADVFTIRSCTGRIRRELTARDGRVTFEALTKASPKLEIIVTFMAVLEMVSGGEVRIEQEHYCGEISIYAIRLLKNDEKISYMDETE